MTMSRRLAAGPARGHPGRTFGVIQGPAGIVGSAAPADHPATEQEGRDGDDDHAKGFALDMGHGIECNLAAVIGGGITQLEGTPGVGGLVQDHGQQKGGVPTQAFDYVKVFHHGDDSFPKGALWGRGKHVSNVGFCG